MKESKKAKLRSIFKYLGLSLYIVCILILPILKLLNLYNISWFDAFIPMMFTIGFNLFFLLGYFAWWLVQPGTEN